MLAIGIALPRVAWAPVNAHSLQSSFMLLTQFRGGAEGLLKTPCSSAPSKTVTSKNFGGPCKSKEEKWGEDHEKRRPPPGATASSICPGSEGSLSARFSAFLVSVGETPSVSALSHSPEQKHHSPC